MNGLWNDIKFGIRILAKKPGFTLTVILTLALGIGANTAIFSVINTLLLRSLPVQNPNELVLMSMKGDSRSNPSFNYPIYEKLRDGNTSLTGMIAAGEYTARRRMVALEMGGKETEFIKVRDVTGNFFSMLGVSAIAGRVFTSEDDRKENPQPVGVISHNFWKRRFGNDPSVIGKAVTIDDIHVTIIGVTPPEFFGIETGNTPDLWLPLQLAPIIGGDTDGRTLGQYSWWLRVMGRVSKGVEPSRAQAELDTIYQRHLLEELAEREREGEGEVNELPRVVLAFESGSAGWTELRGQYERPLLVLMVIVGVVLLIACANVASLLLSRGAARTKEFSVRGALGAGRFQLIRQLMTESLLLSAAGGVAGLLFAQWGTRVLLLFMNRQNDPVSFDLSPDGLVLAFTAGATLLTGLLFGLAPALRSSRGDLIASLKGTAGGVAGYVTGQKLQKSLVALQVALSLALLTGAGLFIRTLDNLKSLDAGFARENVVLFDFDFSKNMEGAERISFYKNLLSRLDTLPGVQSASLSIIQPLSGAGWADGVSVEGYEEQKRENLTCFGMRVGPDYFKTMGTPVLSGRDFGSEDEQPIEPDDANAYRTAVISETMAKRYFGDENPVGKHFFFVRSPDQKYEIVGVVKDTKYVSLREAPRATFYVPFFQEPESWGMTFALRTTGDPRPVMSSIQGIIRETNPAVQARNVRTMDEVVNRSLHQERVITQLGGFFSGAALLLACLGLYGVLSFGVAQRTREIGVRVALGAQPRDVLSLVIGQGLKLALLGSVLGIVAALMATRLVASLLYGVEPTDPVTFISVSLLLLFVAAAASFIPACRAASVDPMSALRYE